VSEAGGKSVYGPTNNSEGFPTTLTISHSESSENKPEKTKRVLVRIDLSGILKEGQEVTAFAYAVLGVPKSLIYPPGSDTTSASPLDYKDLLGALIAALACNNSDGKTDETRISRLIAGES
jgi:hypothetical protein